MIFPADSALSHGKTSEWTGESGSSAVYVLESQTGCSFAGSPGRC